MLWRLVKTKNSQRGLRIILNGQLRIHLPCLAAMAECDLVILSSDVSEISVMVVLNGVIVIHNCLIIYDTILAMQSIHLNVTPP